MIGSILIAALFILFGLASPSGAPSFVHVYGWVSVWVGWVAWAAIPPLGLAPFRITSCIARPGGVSYSGWFRRLEFSPSDTLLLIEGQWHGLTLITFIRTDGAWKRLTVDQSGLTHLLGCWRLPGPEALPDKLQVGPLVR